MCNRRCGLCSTRKCRVPDERIRHRPREVGRPVHEAPADRAGRARPQVGVADAQRLRQAAAQSKLVLFPEANHVLKAVETDDRAANLATYGRADLPLAPGVVDAIADFVLAPRLQQPPRTDATR